MKFDHRGRVIYGVAGVLLVCLIAVRMRQTQAIRTEEAHLDERFTRQEIAARTEQLCRVVMPQIGELRLSPEYVGPQLQRGTLQNCWFVMCHDAAGDPVASVAWNADTGALWSFARQKEPLAMDGQEKLSRKAAVKCAWQWLCRLGVAVPLSQWRLAGVPEWNERAWFVCWKTEGQAASVLLDDRTGALRCLRCWSPRPLLTSAE